MRQEGAHFSRHSKERFGMDCNRWRKLKTSAGKTRVAHAIQETSEDDNAFTLHNCAAAEKHNAKSSRTVNDLELKPKGCNFTNWLLMW